MLGWLFLVACGLSLVLFLAGLWTHDRGEKRLQIMLARNHARAASRKPLVRPLAHLAAELPAITRSRRRGAGIVFGIVGVAYVWLAFFFFAGLYLAWNGAKAFLGLA